MCVCSVSVQSWFEAEKVLVVLTGMLGFEAGKVLVVLTGMLGFVAEKVLIVLTGMLKTDQQTHLLLRDMKSVQGTQACVQDASS